MGHWHSASWKLSKSLRELGEHGSAGSTTHRSQQPFEVDSSSCQHLCAERSVAQVQGCAMVHLPLNHATLNLDLLNTMYTPPRCHPDPPNPSAALLLCPLCLLRSM